MLRACVYHHYAAVIWRERLKEREREVGKEIAGDDRAV
jgi:hypothetical protein